MQREALTGVPIGQPLSRERTLNLDVDAFYWAEDRYFATAKLEERPKLRWLGGWGGRLRLYEFDELFHAWNGVP